VVEVLPAWSLDAGKLPDIRKSIYRRYAIVDAAVLREAATKLDIAAGTISGTSGEADENSKTKTAWVC